MPDSKAPFFFFQRIYGHPCSFTIPLDAFVRLGDDGDFEARGRLVQEYLPWITASDYAGQLCFLDITFGPVGAQREAHDNNTLIVAPDELRVTYYDETLKNFFRTQSSLAANYVFQRGLPSFVSTDDSKTPNTPEDRRSLEQIESEGQRWKYTDDRFLMFSSVSDSKVSASHNPDARPAFCGRLIQTFSEFLQKGVALDEKVSVYWDRYVGLLMESSTRHRLLSVNGSPLGTIVAAPLGIRSPDNPGGYQWIADVFFGLDETAGSDIAIAFLKQLTTHLLRVNAGFNAQLRSSRQMVSAMGHEVKKLSVALTERWNPQVERLFKVDVLPDADPVDDGKIGLMLLKPEFEVLRGTMGVAPFLHHLFAVRKALDFWMYSDAMLDNPFDAGVTPNNMAELVRESWAVARDQLILMASHRTNAYSPNAILERIREFDDFKFLLKFSAPVVLATEASLLPVTFVEDQGAGATARRKAFALTRILIAWFWNCLEHGSRWDTVQVELQTADETIEGRDRVRERRLQLRVTNALPESASQEPIWSAPMFDQARAAFLLRRLEEGRAIKKKSVAQRISASTREVLRQPLWDLDASDLEMGRVGDTYRFGVKFPWVW